MLFHIPRPAPICPPPKLLSCEFQMSPSPRPRPRPAPQVLVPLLHLQLSFIYVSLVPHPLYFLVYYLLLNVHFFMAQ